MTKGLILLTTLLGVASGQITCSADFSDCLDPVRAAQGKCGTGAYKSALTCAATLFDNSDCGSDTNQLFLAGGLIGLHSSCRMACDTAADCPFDGPKYAASIAAITEITSSEKRCLTDLVNCQTQWNKCTAASCTCTESAMACSHVAASPCPTFNGMTDGIPSTLSSACKSVGKCTDSQCNSAVTTSAPIALVAAISAVFLLAFN